MGYCSCGLNGGTGERCGGDWISGIMSCKMGLK